MSDKLTLEDIALAKKIMDEQPAPKALGYYNSYTDKVTYTARVKEYTLNDLKKIFPIK